MIDVIYNCRGVEGIEEYGRGLRDWREGYSRQKKIGAKDEGRRVKVKLRKRERNRL